MKKIISIVDRRRAVEKKKTAVAWHGKPLSQEKIDRAKKRYGTATGNCKRNPSDLIARPG
jgi:transketolase